MDKMTKELVRKVIKTTKKYLEENNVAIEFDKDSECLMFYDTNANDENNKFDGLKISLDGFEEVTEKQMDEEAKEEIKIALEILKATLIRNGVSIGANKETGTLYFFDTLTYVSNGKFDGFKMVLDELVR